MADFKTTAQELGLPDDPAAEAVVKLIRGVCLAKWANAVHGEPRDYQTAMRIEWQYAKAIVGAVREIDNAQR